ncbi:hypothetical protein Pint_07385 [Pistacia integerrima]|uniref:Uncharacterized protein n=1 Tax=Pistacia integerrima TaxID=434235 RepID=A0ACC0XYQ9_9ROSI|nr:hypothetical protein Pint_07385 [Pistacia integerrima]
MLQSLPELPLHLRSFQAPYCKQLVSFTLPRGIEELNEAEFEIASKRCYKIQRSFSVFIFTHSKKLNHNHNLLAELRFGIESLAIASIKRCCEEETEEVLAVSLNLPGSEIPDWFSHRRSGSFIQIRLPRRSSNERFTGFLLCAVTTFEGSYSGGFAYVRVTYYFDSNYEEEFYCELSIGYVKKGAMEPDHIVLGYSPRMDVDLLKGDYTTVSFWFSLIQIKGQSLNHKVKCCGVYPLYIHPKVSKSSSSIEELATINQGSGEIAVDDCYDNDHDDTDGSGSDMSDEEMEPSPNKRIIRGSDSILRIRGGLLLSYCWTLMVCFFCGLCVFRLLESLVIFLSS